MNHTRQRDEWVDALRVLALFGVFVVNVVGYPELLGGGLVLGTPNPTQSIAALGLHGMMLAFIQGKAYPLLCFLFGYSAFTQHRKTRVTATLRQRYWKLLLIGVVHGACIYVGDILTMYAIAGLLSVGWLTKRASNMYAVWNKLHYWLVAIFVLLALLGLFLLWGKGETPTYASLVTEQSWWSLFLLSLSYYFMINLANFIVLPMYLWMFVAGALASRFSLLEVGRNSAAYWQGNLGRNHLYAALFGNMALGVLGVYLHLEHPEKVGNLTGIIATPLNLYLAAVLLATFMRYRLRRAANHQPTPAWLAYLAPAGRHTLVMYLSLSCALLASSGAFLALHGTTAQRTLAAVLGWLVAVQLARRASLRAKPLKDPLTRWLGRPFLEAPHAKQSHSPV